MVPGFISLFGEQQLSYEGLLEKLPTETAITVAIMVNTELYTPLPYDDQQKRIFNALTYRFTKMQKHCIINAFQQFHYRSNGIFSQDIFRREYLLKMILKEAKRNATFELTDDSGEQEHNFLLAYLMIIDEINKSDVALMEELRQYENDPLGIYIREWTPNLNKYQFNERVNPAFEIFKLACLSKYALEKMRVRLKEYLNLFGFSTIGNLLHFFNTGVQAALKFDENDLITKPYYINPNTIDPFGRQAINNSGLNREINIEAIKVSPLFYVKQRGYLVIDKYFYFKKIYRGPLFEIAKNTGMKEAEINKYSGKVSKEVMEKICFQSIIKNMVDVSNNILHFDDDSKDGLPDGFYRINNVVFVIEFKANVLAKKHFGDIDKGKGLDTFNDFKKALDERFIQNEDKKPKGITQLRNQIQLIKEEPLEFDKNFSAVKSQNEIFVYPILCHNEFYFSMPGINEYLNDEFLKMVSPLQDTKFVIKNVTLVNLDHLFDFSLRQGTFSILREFIDKYWAVISNRKNDPFNSDPISSRRSFDEFYTTSFVKELPNVGDGHDENSIPALDKLLNAANITQDLLNEIV